MGRSNGRAAIMHMSQRTSARTSERTPVKVNTNRNEDQVAVRQRGVVALAATLLACSACSGILGVGDFLPEAASDVIEGGSCPDDTQDAGRLVDGATNRDAAADDALVVGPLDARAPDPREILGSRLVAWLDADDPVRSADADGSQPLSWPSRGSGFDFVGCGGAAPQPRLRRGLAKLKGQSAFDFSPSACSAANGVFPQTIAGNPDIAIFSVAHFLPLPSFLSFLFRIESADAGYGGAARDVHVEGSAQEGGPIDAGKRRVERAAKESVPVRDGEDLRGHLQRCPRHEERRRRHSPSGRDERRGHGARALLFLG